MQGRSKVEAGIAVGQHAGLRPSIERGKEQKAIHMRPSRQRIWIYLIYLGLGALHVLNKS